MLTVQMLGRLAITRDGAAIDGLESRKVKELLCFLILNCQRPHQRESLASTLWSNTLTAQSRANLRKVLWQLQSAFDQSAGEPSISIDPEWIQVSPQADLWCDVAELKAAFRQVCDVAGETLSAAAAQMAEEAVRLYHGDLLEGWYQDWCLFERERVQSIYLALLDKLMAYYEARQQFELGLAHGATILRYDRARELTHRRLMRLLFLSGDRTGALRQYERCAAIVGEEFDASPSEPTSDLYQRIKANRPLDDGVEPGEGLLTAQGQIEALLPRLRELQHEAASIWQAMEENIRLIERLVNSRLR